MIKKIINGLFSPMFMGVLFIIMAVALAIATFIENDYGAAASGEMVYKAWWFELLFFLSALNLTGQIIIFRLYRRGKITVFLFHAAFIVMIIGAAITRYTGFEGIMHIREGESKNNFMSLDNYITVEVTDAAGTVVDKAEDKFSTTNVSVDSYEQNLSGEGFRGVLRLVRFIPNASETVVDAPGGRPIVSMLVTAGMTGREVVFISQGETVSAAGLKIGFGSGTGNDIDIDFVNGRFFVRSEQSITATTMSTQEGVTHEAGSSVALETMIIYNIGAYRFIPQKVSSAGTIKPMALDASRQQTGMNALEMEYVSGSSARTLFLWERADQQVSETSFTAGDNLVKVAYGPKTVTLPFEIRLNDFILERYPGSTSPSGYKSDVVLIDKEQGIETPYLIFMNNILKHRGYRFYQSSYDRDELGTVLSVNSDLPGMLVTYFGYGILILFIVFSMANPSSQFRKVTASYWTSPFRKISAILLLLIGTSFLVPAKAQRLIVNKSAADEFGKVLVQDQKGRTKPLYTLSSDILRKVSRENEFLGYTPMQVFLGLYFDFDNWKDVPMIKVSGKELQTLVGVRSEYAAFSDIVDLSAQGSYKLEGMVEEAYAKTPAARSKTDKEIIKLDERVNICYMIYRGDFMKVFPIKDGTTHWGNPEEAIANAINREDSLFLSSIMPMYAEAVRNNNNTSATEITQAISGYQERFSEYDLPASGKVKAEVLYYKMKIFERLFPAYATAGLIMLLGLLFMVVTGRSQINVFLKTITALLLVGLLLHTFGLGLRWYISGHSPMSNGYESMIFISWVTLIAGFWFRRKSWFALAATAVLAGMTLMVAHLSFMDPEITALVPVLQSYWLTLHVSVITGSYGFLGLGALLGLIVMILTALARGKNMERIGKTIDDLTVINYKSLTLGLYFLTIGTFLGAIWANESWGRYWGWDPKETWSLITIIVYSFVIHSRIIPGMKDVYTFNVMALFSFASVLMTYFGVNYYLSGLHSYAGGDPVPVPSFVYVSVVLLLAIAILAYRRYLAIEKLNK
jgi:cytochrome c-type biogenesis protein CcsB